MNWYQLSHVKYVSNNLFRFQGQAIAQLVRTFDGVTLFGVASKGKHEELATGGLFDHLIDRTDYSNEVRKWVMRWKLLSTGLIMNVCL